MDGLYDLKRFECVNNIFNVIDGQVTIAGVTETVPDGYYTFTQLAAAVQLEMVKQDATATCTYASVTDKFSISSTTYSFNDLLSVMLGLERREFTGAITSSKRPMFSPFHEIKVQWSQSREGDHILLTSAAPYGSRIIWEPAEPEYIYFMSAVNPVITATSFGRTIPLQGVSYVFEKL